MVSPKKVPKIPNPVRVPGILELKKFFPILKNNGKKNPKGTNAITLPTKLMITVFQPNASL